MNDLFIQQLKSRAQLPVFQRNPKVHSFQKTFWSDDNI